MDATIFVHLSRDRTLSSAGYGAKLRRGLHDDPQFADLGFRFASHDTPAPVNIRLSGGKTAERRRLAEEVRRRLATVKGAVDVEIVQRMDAPYVSVRVERRKAAEVGLSPAEVASQVSAALGLRVPFEHSVWGDNTDGEYSFSVPFPKEPSVNTMSLALLRSSWTKRNPLCLLSSCHCSRWLSRLISSSSGCCT